uniref:aldehyde dehydrogenase family protein n=1 Tax=uncultured Sphingomonas sp. TaxID=158754 RepID=UPI00260E1812
MTIVQHFVGGARIPGGDRQSPVFNPNDGQVARRVLLGDRAVLDLAVEKAAAAQPGWARVNPQRRSRVLFEYKRLVEL